MSTFRSLLIPLLLAGIAAPLSSAAGQVTPGADAEDGFVSCADFQSFDESTQMAYALGLYRGFEVAAMHVEDQAGQMDSTYASIDEDTISSLSGAVAGMKTAANQLRQTMTFSGNRTWGELAGRLSAVCSRPALEDEPVATLLLQVFEEMQ